MTKKRGTNSKKRTGARELSVKVKTAKGRKLSSTRWLQRQLNDPYVAAAKRDGYRSRAAYKLVEIDDKYKFLKKGRTVVDLGCAPGGWSQVASKRVQADQQQGMVVGMDLQPVDPIPGVVLLEGDFTDYGVSDRLVEALEEKPVNIVLSDMAASSTGHKQTDHLRIIGLCETALDFATDVLAEDGVFLAKVLQGGTEKSLLDNLKRNFKSVYHVKPKASRADSSELYVLATGFRG